VRIEQRISPAKVSLLEFIATFETEWNWIPHFSQSSTTSSFTYRKIVKDLFPCQELKTNILLAWFAESHNNVVEMLMSKDHVTYYMAKKRILNLPSNYHLPLDLHPRTPSLNTRLTLFLNRIARRTRRRRESRPPLLMRATRSLISVECTHQALGLVISGHSIKSSKNGEIKMVLK
jgi:hypothetical protein